MRQKAQGWMAFGRRRALLLELKEKIGTYRCWGRKEGLPHFFARLEDCLCGTLVTLLDTVRGVQDLGLC